MRLSDSLKSGGRCSHARIGKDCVDQRLRSSRVATFRRQEAGCSIS
jgi:hypothetical protein